MTLAVCIACPSTVGLGQTLRWLTILHATCGAGPQRQSLIPVPVLSMPDLNSIPTRTPFATGPRAGETEGEERRRGERGAVLQVTPQLEPRTTLSRDFVMTALCHAVDIAARTKDSPQAFPMSRADDTKPSLKARWLRAGFSLFLPPWWQLPPPSWTVHEGRESAAPRCSLVSVARPQPTPASAG